MPFIGILAWPDHGPLNDIPGLSIIVIISGDQVRRSRVFTYPLLICACLLSCGTVRQIDTSGTAGFAHETDLLLEALSSEVHSIREIAEEQLSEGPIEAKPSVRALHVRTRDPEVKERTSRILVLLEIRSVLGDQTWQDFLSAGRLKHKLDLLGAKQGCLWAVRLAMEGIRVIGEQLVRSAHDSEQKLQLIACIVDAKLEMFS